MLEIFLYNAVNLINIMYTALTFFHQTSIQLQNHAFRKNMINDDGFSILLILIILLILFLFNIRKRGYVKNKATLNNFFTFDQTTQMKGLAIVCIVFYHYVSKLIVNPSIDISFINALGPIGVSTFLLISGYGLVQTYMTNGKVLAVKTFILRRGKRVYLPYLIVVLGFVFLSQILQVGIHISYLLWLISAINIGEIISNQIIDPLMWWFVTYVIIYYIVFYLIFHTKFKDYTKILLLFLFASLINFTIARQIAAYTFTLPVLWGYYAFCFPVGVAIGVYYKKLQKAYQSLSRNKKILTCVSIILLSCSYIPGVQGTQYVFFSFLIISFVLLMTQWYRRSSILYFLGTISYEIFLIHIPLMVVYDFFLFRQPLFLWFFIYTGIVIALSSLLHYGLQFLFNIKVNSLAFTKLLQVK